MATREEQEYSSQAPAGYIGDFLQTGIFPYAKQFLTDQFDNMGRPDSSPFTYTGPRVAQFDPRERYAMDLQDAAIGSYRPYLGEQAGLLSEAADVSRAGTVRGADEISQGLRSGRNLTSQANITGQGATRAFDPRGIGSFYNPFEDAVVQQTLTDLDRQGAQQDMALRDRAVSSGAFGGSRGRLAQGELARQQERGVAEAIAGIRSGGYQDSANRAQQAFEAQQGRQAQFAGLQGQLGQGMFGMGLQGGTGLAGLGSQFTQGFGQLGQQYGSMAPALQGLQQNDIQSMMGMGGLGRGRSQSLMDLGYQNFVGQYNLPMQLVQNLGSLTASLGPLAGGYGYAGGAPATNSAYTPTNYSTPYTGVQNMSIPFQQTPYTPPTSTPPTGTPQAGLGALNPFAAQPSFGSFQNPMSFGGLGGLYNNFQIA